MAKIARFFNRSGDTNRKTKYTPRTGSKVQPTNNQQGAKTMSNTTEFATICGKTIQIDRSGVGHNWRNLTAADLTDDLADTIAAEIIDGNRPAGAIVIGGIHYRWK